MIGQSSLKQRNQPQRECLYAWYPEAVDTSNYLIEPREIYIHQGIDRTLLSENPFQRVNSNDDELIQRYKQSLAPSERVYQATETIDEALKTPWALHYEVERRPATPNIPSHQSETTTRDEIPRRLKSAPLIRSLPSSTSTVLTVPEPQFLQPIISDTSNEKKNNNNNHNPSVPRVRAASAKARLNSTLPASFERTEELPAPPVRREIKSAIGLRTTPVPIPTEQIPQGATLVLEEKKVPLARPHLQEASLPPNLYHHHRPGVVGAMNVEKKPLLRLDSASKKSTRHHRHHRHSAYVEQRHQPLLAVTPISPNGHRPPVTPDGIQLIYDRTLTLDDRSLNLTKYFIDGNLYLIKDQRYNVIENFDPSLLEKLERAQTLPPRPKYYQTIPIDKLQIPKPAPELHYNASETYFYNTIPKRVHRYVIDPNFISEHLNVNKMALSERPPTGHGHRASSRETQRSGTASRTRAVYA